MKEPLDVYEGLAEHLNRLPSGFPRTETGVEMRILRRLFSPEEAAVAQLLTLRPESPEHLAARTGRPIEALAAQLEQMASKGLIFRIRKKDQVRYMAAQFVIGIWEYHVNDLDPELIRDCNEYLPYFFEHYNRFRVPQLRTIPISRSLVPEEAVMPYEEARRLVLEQEAIVVAPCICRKEHQMVGGGCEKPMETCLVFGAGAQYYEENGLGRPIGHEEALKILEKAEESGLVLQPSNAQRVVNICTCCGCCCQILKNLKKLPQPERHVASNYFAVLDAEQCTGCGLCLERCQMDAFHLEGDIAVLQKDRCIGCGLCVTTCSGHALHLERKPEAERHTPPAHLMETYKRLIAERASRAQAAKEAERQTRRPLSKESEAD